MEINGRSVEVIDTPEKFAGMAGEVVPVVLELLKALAEAESKAHDEYEAMEAEKPALGLSKHEAHPKFLEFWSGYRQTLGELLKPVCSDKLLNRGYGNHCGELAKFAYINGKCGVFFTMKSAKKALVETEFAQGTLTMRHRFAMKLCEDRWVVDDMKYSLDGGESWEKDSI